LFQDRFADNAGTGPVALLFFITGAPTVEYRPLE
jgi:hypothetical protein